MSWFRIALSALALASVVGAFLGLPTELACRIQPAATLVFLVVVLLTFVWGRFFCATLCPLGIVQSLVNWIFHPKTNVRRVCTRLPRHSAQRIVNFAFLALALTLGWSALNPYGIFGRALTLWIPGVVVLAAVLVLAAVGKGRVWCNWVCPFGTVFDLLSRFSWRKDKVGRHCANCRRCFAMREEGKGKREEGTGNREQDAGGVSRRETLKGIAVLAVAEKLTDGGLADITLPGRPSREVKVLPPGAVGTADAFARRCVGCQLCVARCPGGCLKPSADWKDFGTVRLEFQKGYCIENCTKCSEVCPAGALARLTREEKRNRHIGVAVWHKDLCVRTTSGDACTACVKKCPKGAIHVVGGFPVVDADACVGCGACEHVCPARPLPAISVNGLDVQRQVTPIGKADLVDEMRRQIDVGGASVVVARDGVIVRQETGEGVVPVQRLSDEGALKGSLVFGREVDDATAAILVAGGAKEVIARTMSASVRQLLDRKRVRHY